MSGKHAAVSAVLGHHAVSVIEINDSLFKHGSFIHVETTALPQEARFRITTVIEPWVDPSHKDPNKDKLARGPFVKMSARLIERLANSNDSTVLGLVGPWGSGKSTVLNYIKRELAKDIKIVWFNPWSFDEEQLQAELYAAILAAYPKGSRETLRRKASKLVRRNTPALKAIPKVGPALAETVGEYVPEESWHTAFKDLAGTIKKASVKVLVVVDDVDRLQPKDLLLVMKTIRLLGRFPRVNYLLAYDRESTIATLGTALGGAEIAGSYLEKIVQYPLDLPAPQQVYLQQIVSSYLDPVLTSASVGMIGPTPATRFAEFYGEHMWETLATPRACYRYAMQAVTFLDLGKGDVDPSDFFALTFLRLFYPELFKALPGWADHLATSRDDTTRPNRLSEDEWKVKIRDLGYPETKATELARALASLFPTAFSGNHWGSAGGKYRAYDIDYFHRYFNYSLPAGDVSDVTVQRDLNAILQSRFPSPATYPDTFDHPLEDVKMRAVRKGRFHTDYESDTRNLVHYLSNELSKPQAGYGTYVGSRTIKEMWLAKLIGSQKPWPAQDIEDFVQKFARPADLGYALRDYSGAAPDLGYTSTYQPTPPDLDPDSFAVQLRESWTMHAVSWLLNEWQSTDSAVSELELFQVRGYIDNYGGRELLQSATLDAMQAGALSLSTLLPRFVVCTQKLGYSRALPSSLELRLSELENTVPPEQLQTLPLAEPAAVSPAKGEEIPSPDQRARFGYEELMRWRDERANAASSDENAPCN